MRQHSDGRWPRMAAEQNTAAKLTARVKFDVSGEDGLDSFLAESLPTDPEPEPPAQTGLAKVSEPTDLATAPAVTSVQPSARVSLEDVLARGVPVHWIEAVAIVEELCAVLMRDPSAVCPLPDVADIFLSERGSIEVGGSRSTERSVAGLGRVLSALLSTGTVPVGLRLFVTRATMPEAHDSVATFASELAYFEPPGDRAALLRAVYERCRNAPVPSVPRAPDMEQREEKEQPAPPRPRRMPVWPIAVAVLIAFACAGVVMVQQAGGVTSLPSFSLPSLSLGGTPTATAEASAPSTPNPRASRRTKSAAASGTRHLATSPTRLRGIVDSGGQLGAPPAGLARSLILSLPVPTPVPAIEPPGASRPVTAPPETVIVYLRTEPAPVYSSANTDVTPPVMVFPHLPQPTLPEAREYVNTLELLIDELGAVEQARLLTRPRRMPDMMILSGAKNWKFEPASKDGSPVKYRTVVQWTVSP